MRSIFCFKKLFFVKHFLKRHKLCIFCLCRGPPFKKVFFCQPFFEKIQTLHFLFQNGFFFLKRYFLFVSWPSLQIPFLLGKSLENFVSLGKPCIHPFSKKRNIYKIFEGIQRKGIDSKNTRDSFGKPLSFLVFLSCIQTKKEEQKK